MNNNSGIFSNVLNSLNSTLNIVNKAIPIYKEAKPILNTVTSTYKKIKNNGKEIPKLIKLIKLKNEFNKENNTTKIPNTFNTLKKSNVNNPKFFL